MIRILVVSNEKPVFVRLRHAQFCVIEYSFVSPLHQRIVPPLALHALEWLPLDRRVLCIQGPQAEYTHARSGIRTAHAPTVAGLHLGAKSLETAPQSRVETPLCHRAGDRPHESRPPHGQKPPQEPLRRPLQRQNGRHRLQLPAHSQVAGGFGLMVYAVDVGEYRQSPKNGRLLTGDSFGNLYRRNRYFPALMSPVP